MSENEFKIGDRVFFKNRYCIGEFGNVIRTDHAGFRLLVQADSGMFYDCWKDEIVNLKEDDNK